MATEDDGWLSYKPKIWAKQPTEFLARKRLETISLKVRFHDTMSKAKLETFSHHKQENGVPKRNRGNTMWHTHPLGPLPWSLAAPDGSLKKTAKSSLAKELERCSGGCIARIFKQHGCQHGLKHAQIAHIQGEYRNLYILCPCRPKDNFPRVKK